MSSRGQIIVTNFSLLLFIALVIQCAESRDLTDLLISSNDLKENSHEVTAKHPINLDSLHSMSNEITFPIGHQQFLVPSTPTERSAWVEMLVDLIKGAIAPAVKYSKLVSRYRAWYNQYNSLRKSVSFPTKGAIEVFSAEYVKTDERMSNRVCNSKLKEIYEAQAKAGTIATTEVKLNAKDMEKVDFVYQTLSQTISVLEQQLNDAQRTDGSNHILEYAKDDRNPIEAQRIDEAIGRLKNSAFAATSSLTNNHIVRMAQAAALGSITGKAMNQAAQMIGGRNLEIIKYLGPMMQLLGMPTPDAMIANYLMNIDLRSALALGSKNSPVVYYKCKDQPGLRLRR